MKYIDAEKLKAEIERRRLSNRYIDTEGYEAELFEIIDSLQQEQPDVDLEKELEKYCRIYYNCNYPDQIQNGKCSVVMPHIVEAARYFYELGRKGGNK